jgi:hypothetical protein
MNERDLNQQMEGMRKLLKTAVPPVTETEPHRDLWPQMLRRLETVPAPIPWWDWALLAAAATVFFFFPGTIPALLYHL